MSSDPSFMSPEFALACQGYLSIDVRRLPDMLRALPAAESQRERAVVAAIRYRLDRQTKRRA